MTLTRDELALAQTYVADEEARAAMERDATFQKYYSELEGQKKEGKGISVKVNILGTFRPPMVDGNWTVNLILLLTVASSYGFALES